jgi:hypothetical protein
MALQLMIGDFQMDTELVLYPANQNMILHLSRSRVMWTDNGFPNYFFFAKTA